MTAGVLARLADGGFHSGEALAKSLEVSRASVWNAVRDLETAGIEVYKVHGRGYRLPYPVTLLDRRNHHVFQPLLYQVATAGLSPAQIAAVQADTKMPAKDKKAALADLNAALKTPAPAIENKGNIDLVAKNYDKLAAAMQGGD